MTSKQRAYLKSIAMTTEPILRIGKSSLTPEFTPVGEGSSGCKRTDQNQCFTKLYG